MRWLAVLVLAAGCASPPGTTEELAEARREIARLEDEVAMQKAALEKTEDEEARTAWELVDALKETARLEHELAVLKATPKDGEVERLREQVRELSNWLEWYSKHYGDVGRGSEGVVLRVNGTSITISLGSADGLRVGDIYHIRRRDLYVGRMTVAEVAKHRSRGVLDSKVAGPGAPPRRADVAYPGGR